MSAPVVTRFAPSPTGSLHLGNVRTALFSYLWARKSGGRFILRIEDTDVERSDARHRADLIAELRWLGLEWDEGPEVGGPNAPYLQSERGAWYRELFVRLESEGRAYPCYCTPDELELSRKLERMAGRPPRYAGTCRALTAAERAARLAQGRKPTLRFAVPDATVIEFTDLVHGAQRFSSTDIGDFIIRREDGTAAFFFSNAVDDSVMGVTHVLRGDDHLTNTPRQLMLLDALGMRRPAYGHVGLLVGADGAPLSKRHGSTSVQEFRERGFLPAALLNHLFRLGHTADVDGWLAPEQMPAHFRPEHLGRASARFEESQLLHWQKETLRHMSAAEIAAWLGFRTRRRSSSWCATTWCFPRMRSPGCPWCAASCRRSAPRSSVSSLPRGAPSSRRRRRHWIDRALICTHSPQCSSKRPDAGGAELYMPLRVALTGQTHGPELAPILKLMPLETARRRLESHARNS